MDTRDFVAMIKQYAVDDVVQQVVNGLKAPRLPTRLQANHSQVKQSISKWINDHSLVEQYRSEWFNLLTADDQRMISEILEECAERAVANFFALLDGVGGEYEGVFEI